VVLRNKFSNTNEKYKPNWRPFNDGRFIRRNNNGK